MLFLKFSLDLGNSKVIPVSLQCFTCAVFWPDLHICLLWYMNAECWYILVSEEFWFPFEVLLVWVGSVWMHCSTWKGKEAWHICQNAIDELIGSWRFAFICRYRVLSKPGNRGASPSYFRHEPSYQSADFPRNILKLCQKTIFLFAKNIKMTVRRHRQLCFYGAQTSRCSLCPRRHLVYGRHVLAIIDISYIQGQRPPYFSRKPSRMRNQHTVITGL